MFNKKPAKLTLAGFLLFIRCPRILETLQRREHLHYSKRAMGPRLRGDPAYFCASTHFTSACASASDTCVLAGIGTGPQTPAPPLMTFAASLASASF
jgi:hypothetical protein